VAPGEGAVTALALAVDEAHDELNPVEAMRTWQVGQLARWRAAKTLEEERRFAPLVWAALVTYVLPDRVEVENQADD
jgi:hypothetical protein